MLFVPKKDGELRPCMDYCKLNVITVKNRYRLPNAQRLRDLLTGANWFTSLDQRNAYNLIPMKKGEEWKTAFRTRYGLYEYLVMPFGLTNAPATCQELANDTFMDILDVYVVVYLDDILIFVKGSLAQHVNHVKEVLRRLQARTMKLKLSKCQFHKKEVEFLGYIVGENGVRMNPKKGSLNPGMAPTNNS